MVETDPRECRCGHLKLNHENLPTPPRDLGWLYIHEGKCENCPCKEFDWKVPDDFYLCWGSASDYA